MFILRFKKKLLLLDKIYFKSIVINIYINLKYFFKLKTVNYFFHSTRSHGLDKELIISLTSYPERFKTLPLVLESLQKQSVAADKIELWIEENDKNKLTSEIFKFNKVKVKFCENDLFSYKKIIPALAENKNRYIATFDDDVIYPFNSLESLINMSKNFPGDIIANRMHKIKLINNMPDTYNNWEHDFKKFDPLVFLTGVGGVLYPPRSFHDDILKIDLFKKFCPTNDDIWINWMIKLNKNNIRFSNIATSYEMIKIIKTGLYKKNVKQKHNDTQINLMIEQYGFPYQK